MDRLIMLLSFGAGTTTGCQILEPVPGPGNLPLIGLDDLRCRRRWRCAGNPVRICRPLFPPSALLGRGMKQCRIPRSGGTSAREEA